MFIYISNNIVNYTVRIDGIDTNWASQRPSQNKNGIEIKIDFAWL